MERVGEMERKERKVDIIKVDRTCTSLALLRLNVGYRIEIEEHASRLPCFPASLHPSQTTIKSSVYVSIIILWALPSTLASFSPPHLWSIATKGRAFSVEALFHIHMRRIVA